MAYINDNGLGPDSDDALLTTAADILESGAGPSRSQRGWATRNKLLWKPNQGAVCQLLLNLYKEQEHLTDTLLAELKLELVCEMMKKYCRMDHRSIKRWSKQCCEGWARKIRPLNRLGLISVQRIWISGFWLSTVALFQGAVMLKSALQEF